MATLQISDAFKRLIFLINHPVNSLYFSDNATNPKNFYGGNCGNWQQINGYYIYAGNAATNTNYTGMGTQGHLLTANQSGLRDHAHGYWYFECSPVLSPNNQGGGRALDPQNRWYDNTGRIGNSGSADAAEKHAHNIATHQCYVFKRIS